MSRTTLAIIAALLLIAPASVFAGDCSSSSASVSITSGPNHSCPSSLTSGGTWSVSNGAGVVLKYYVGSTPIQEEMRFGSSGSWSLSDTWDDDDGSYTLNVDVFPLVDNGSGYTTCLQNGSSDDGLFSVSCPTPPSVTIDSCSWSCSGFGPSGSCTGTCTASISGGTPNFGVDWRVNSTFDHSQSTSGSTITSQTITCSPAFDQVKVQVTDANSLSSNTASWPCGAH